MVHKRKTGMHLSRKLHQSNTLYWSPEGEGIQNIYTEAGVEE